MSSRVAMVGVLVSLAMSCAYTRRPSVNGAIPIDVESSTTAETRPGLAQMRQRQFEERRASGRGVILSENEIRNAKAATLLTLLRRVPSVRVSCLEARCVVSMSRATAE